MKKLFAIVIAASMLTGLYALSLDLGVAYEDVSHDSRYFSVKGSVIAPVLPIIDWRAGLVLVNLPTDNTNFHVGTGLTSDLMFKIPMPAAFQPYLVFGFTFNDFTADPGWMHFDVEAGLGGEMAFGGFSGYLEGGLHSFTYDKIGDLDAVTYTPLYVQLGVRFPLGI